MVLNTKQQIATAFLAVLIVASVLAMPRTPVDTPRESRPVRSGVIASAPAATASELSNEHVKDLTYN